jgi:hypothetical protein
MRYIGDSELVGHPKHPRAVAVVPGPPPRPLPWDEDERLAAKGRELREFMHVVRERKDERERRGVWL